LGVANTDGTYNSLVLLENTSTTVMEAFDQAGALTTDTTDTEDHRILTQDGVPLSVDVYVRMIVPADNATRDTILAEVTPTQMPDYPSNVKVITVKAIYERFAQPEVRSQIRGLFAGYPNYQTLYADYSNVSEKLGEKIATIFPKNGVPLTLQSVSLSNVKPDQTVWAALNQNAAAKSQADAINTIGEALRKNPEYQSYQQWQSLIEMSKSNPNLLIVVNGASGSSTDALTLAILQEMMKKTVPETTVLPTSTPTKTP
jgi:regulator of protease activity HflC (stomatin/prohibitin superfamily)